MLLAAHLVVAPVNRPGAPTIFLAIPTGFDRLFAKCEVNTAFPVFVPATFAAVDFNGLAVNLRPFTITLSGDQFLPAVFKRIFTLSL